MENKKDCKVSACCRTHGCKIVGALVLVLATILTLITYDGMGIFGLFVVGLVFCCHRQMSCRSCSCGCCTTDNTECCTIEKECDTPVKSKKKS